MDHIRFVGIGRITDSNVLLNYLHDKKNKPFFDTYKEEFENILNYVNNPNPNQRDSRNSPNGVWHSFFDDNLICYSGLVQLLTFQSSRSPPTLTDSHSKC